MRLVLALVLCAGILSGATCMDRATGVTPGNPTPTPNNPVAVAGGVVGSLPIPWAGLIGAGISAIPGIWAAIRGRQWKNAAIATAQGVQNALSNLDAAHSQSPLQPSIVADTVKKAIDSAHDDHGVNQGMQNALTPTT